MIDVIESVAWNTDAVTVLDQRALPDRVEYRSLTTADDVIDAIATLSVRGANAIGTVGAFGFALGVRAGEAAEAVARRITGARPTAVNLATAVSRALTVYRAGGDPLQVALDLLDEDREACRRMGEFGRVELVGARVILTHCNTGALATTGWGTALGVVYAKAAADEDVRVLVTETRPLRQGARLTVWELQRAGIDVTLLVDSAAAAALSAGRADAVLVGADRIARNGDTANKIGTLALALAARFAGVPFYIAATLNAIDAGIASGRSIPIELRDGAEVRGLGTGAIDPGVAVWNPAFDVTPAELITGIITEVGVLLPPFSRSIREALGASQ